LQNGRIAGLQEGKARNPAMIIVLNGDRLELGGPLTVADLLVQLNIDARRVAVEHNLNVVKRALFGETIVQDGDQVEIVNFVGGGS
jgi:thiamine biosynthesis protein ThiS